MCGFAGVLACGPDMLGAVARMNAALRHRGPDDEGMIVDGPVALAHRRLAIVDLSAAGHQPMSDASGRFTMVYNGEIYNHAELRARWLGGHAFRGTSDSETLVELFAARGVAAFAELNGIFAAAIWDSRERTLTLVRDGAGVKPLYIWTRPEGGIAFASEIKAIATLPGFGSALDPVAAAAIVTFLWSPGTRTMFTDVAKAPAGEWLQYDAAAKLIRQGSFYRLPDPAPEAMSDAEAVAATRAALERAVERQMLADVEVGCFLSGGLDSSAIVALARAHAKGAALPCFTLAYDDADGAAAADAMANDLPYARLAASHLGVELTEVAISPADARDLPTLVEMLDEPQADLAAMGNWFIARAARERGIKVLLGGAGGDDVFTGYRRHVQFARDGWIGAVPAPLRSLGLSIARRTGQRKLVKALGGMQGGAEERLVGALEWLDRGRASSLMAASVDSGSIAAPLFDALTGTRGQSGLERLLRLDQRFFLRDHNLNYTDKTGMAAGVEIRVPFLDPELMALAARLPARAKLRGATTKWALRKALEPDLPRDILHRPKTGFGVPLRAWIAGPMREPMMDLTSAGTVGARGLFDPVTVRALRDDHEAGRIDAAYPLLSLMMVELWCRRFVDQAA